MSEKVTYGFPDNYKLELGNISILSPNFDYQKENGDTVVGSWNIYPKWNYIEVRIRNIEKRFTFPVFPKFDLEKPSEQRDRFVLEVYETLKAHVVNLNEHKALEELHEVLEKWDISLSTKCINIGSKPLRWLERFEKDYPRLTNPFIRGSS